MIDQKYMRVNTMEQKDVPANMMCGSSFHIFDSPPIEGVCCRCGGTVKTIEINGKIGRIVVPTQQDTNHD